EPDTDRAVRMMRGLTGVLEKHHKVRVMEDAVADAVKLSSRYITDRQLPDKSVSLLDTACARVALGQLSTPAPIEDARREIEHLAVELGILEREQAVGAQHAERVADLAERKQAAQARLAGLEKRWEEEKRLVEEIVKLSERLVAHTDAAKAPGDGKARLKPD